MQNKGGRDVGHYHSMGAEASRRPDQGGKVFDDLRNEVKPRINADGHGSEIFELVLICV